VKVKIRVGEVEIDYEGDATFLKDELLKVCTELGKLNEHAPASRSALHSQHRKTREEHAGGETVSKHSTVTIATLLKAETGPDLVMVAAAYLHFSEGKLEFTRAQILTAMKTAVGYWHENYSGNLTTSLTGLTKTDKLRVVKENTYSLPAKESKRLEAELAKG
jgi:hypothetical protein